MKVFYMFQDNIAFKYESDDYILKSNETIDDYDSQFIRTSIKNHKYIESATQEEIEAHNQQFEINKKKIERETLLKNGVFVQYFWFNEYYLAQFISLIGVCERENKQVEWKNTNDEWVSLSVQSANSIAFQASMKFQEIYKNT